MFENITKEEYLELMEKDFIPTYDELIYLSKARQRLFPIEDEPYNQCRFIGLCGTFMDNIYYKIVYLIILGKYKQFYEYISIWKNELISYIEEIYNVKVESDIKKYKIVKEYIMDTYIDKYKDEWDCITVAIQALKEISKDLDNEKYNIIISILPLVQLIMKQRNYDVVNIYKSLINTFKENNMNIFITTLNKYTNKNYVKKYIR